MPADESLSRYQLGKYLFTREKIQEGGLWGDDPQTSYKMYRDPTADEWDEEPDFAPARDVGTLTVSHLPPAEHFPRRRIIANAAAQREWVEPAVGAEGTGRAVHSKGFHARYSPTDEVELLTVAKESRTMVPTMLALGQRAAKETTGQDLRASTDLSRHSERLVSRLQESGVVPKEEVAHRNRIDFGPALPVGPAGGLEGFLSTLHGRKQRAELMQERYGTEPQLEEPIPRPDVERAKQEGRELVRRSRPGRRSG